MNTRSRQLTTNKFLELYKKLSKVSYHEACVLIMAPDTRMITNTFIYNITKKRVVPNVFLMSFMIYRFPSEIFTLNPNKELSEKSHTLKKDSIALVNTFQKTINCINPNTTEFHQHYNRFKESLEAWKKEDLSFILNTLVNSYYENVEKFSISPSILLKHQETVLLQFKRFGYTRSQAMKYITDNKPNTVKPVTQDAIFYENFKNNLNENPPKLHQIPILLDQLFNSISNKIDKTIDKEIFSKEYQTVKDKFTNYQNNLGSFPQERFLSIADLFMNTYQCNSSETQLEKFNNFREQFNKDTAIQFHYSEILPKFFSGFFKVIN